MEKEEGDKNAPNGENEVKENTRRTKSSSKNMLTFAVDILRVVPEPTKPIKNLRSDRLTDLLAMLFVFGIAMWVRFWFRGEFFAVYPYVPSSQYPPFHLTVGEGDPLGMGSFFGIGAGQVVYTEGYIDFDYYYLDYVTAYSDKNWNPYSGNLEEGDVLNAYVYGPFYIFFISIGRMYFGLSSAESIIWSNLIFDSLCYVMVYVLAKRNTGNVIAMFAAVLGSFSPIALYYAGVKVLNAPSMTFFTLIFLYFFLEHKDKTATFFLVFAILNKQFPLFLAMPFGFWLVRRNGFLKGVIIFLTGFVYSIILSLPWILMTPRSYYIRLFLAGGGKDYLNCPSGGETTNLVHGEIDPDICENSGQVVITDFGMFLFTYINNHVIFFASLFLLAWVGFMAYHKMEKEPQLYYKFFAAFIALSHATIARGIYKYYLTFAIPFFILALIPGDRENSLNIRIGRMLHNGWSAWVDPKVRNKPASISYWSFFFLLLAGTVSVLFLVEYAVSLYTSPGGYHNVWTLIFCVAALISIIKPGGSSTTDKEQVKLKRFNLQNVVFIILTFYLASLLKPIYNEYFEGRNQLSDIYLFRFLLIFLILFTIPYLSSHVRGSRSINSPFTLSYSQLILDIFGIIIAYRIILLFHVQLFLANRFYTTTIMLAYALFFMTLLGEEVWATLYTVPVNAYRRFNELWEIHRSRRFTFLTK